MHALYYLNKYLSQHKGTLLAGALLLLLANIFSLISPRLVKYTFDLVQAGTEAYQLADGADQKRIIYQELAQTILLHSVLIILATILRWGMYAWARIRVQSMGRRIEYALKNEIYQHYQTLPLRFYRQHSTGDLMARISEDVQHVGMYLGSGILHAMGTVMAFSISIPSMWMINPMLTLYAIVPVPIMAAGTYYVSTWMNRRVQAVRAQLSTLTTKAQESFTGLKVLQAFVREKAFIQTFAEACTVYQDRALQLTTVHAFFFPAAIAIIGTGTLVVVFLGGRAIIEGDMTPGSVAEFEMNLNLLAWPTYSVSWLTKLVQSAAASQQRINEFLQVENPIVSTKSIESVIEGSLSFQHVRFTYPDSGIEALKNISFEVAAGQSIALVGATGSGKTTITHLLCRFYDADSGGMITIDGMPIQDYAVPWLRSQVGYVPQDVFLFDDTLYNNITFGTEGASEAQVNTAIQQANLQATVQRLPHGLQTVIGERGVALSGGQKQRVSIARAFLRNPRILILDDCLSAVDTQTEQSILQTMNKVMQGRTTIIVSHRTTAAQLADHILVLDAGKIIEQGTHTSLLAQKKVYYALHKKQQHDRR